MGVIQRDWLINSKVIELKIQLLVLTIKNNTKYLQQTKANYSHFSPKHHSIIFEILNSCFLVPQANKQFNKKELIFL